MPKSCSPNLAGSLDERVDIEAKSSSRTSDGGVTYSWSKDRSAWAKVETLRGDEFFLADQAQNTVTHRVTMRRGHTLSPDRRIKRRDGTLLNVVSINAPHRGQMVEVMCRETTRGSS